jgi:hypothetical protein
MPFQLSPANQHSTIAPYDVITAQHIITSAARVRAQVSLCGICGGQSSNEAGFLRVVRFPLPLIPPTAPHSASAAGTVGQTVADILSGLSLTPPQEI